MTAGIRLNETDESKFSSDLTVPLKGFNEAHNMLVELAKQKSGSADKAPAAPAPAPSTDSNP